MRNVNNAFKYSVRESEKSYLEFKNLIKNKNSGITAKWNSSRFVKCKSSIRTHRLSHHACYHNSPNRTKSRRYKPILYEKVRCF
jgi:hypothetical protein